MYLSMEGSSYLRKKDSEERENCMPIERHRICFISILMASGGVETVRLAGLAMG
jgi:hypothetical protein